MDYNSLTAANTTPGSIAGWVNYSSAILPISDILTEAQALIYKSLRCREMIVSDAAIVVAQGDISETLPAGFLDPINLRDLNNLPMKARDLSTVKRARGLDPSNNWVQGLPRQYAFTGTTVEFDCAADATAAGTYRLDYYGALAALATNNLTNFLTNRYPTLLRYACMAMAADFLNDADRYTRWLEKAQAEIIEIEANNDLALRGAEVVPDFSESY